ncbi:D-glycero-beta-D-manno-heptose 1,7-bisphosphate 7-phosphatase [Amphritea balenae]|uniref:D,D-heptose 1,7-bisphosphate phosphatase n=1 Tax=Amphritea balenae TaxID=452629 RepID=A0A3P1SNY9_9GAMM|nr:D-glycero-beta-D-manno-heptose 1,7-bisphosphate 7-phosphatase [Amphritea balenae]RRC98853.1 D-glycero-beta-D-manno-heptose 1,7-bisphosphate 7-phosphatase [Amphritea balenae]GGK62313.1 D,D-heptose 1,7-bisphosphate phosphatase [Amphritea balenae]
MSKLVILDRDGVINYDSDEYVKSVDEWQPIPGSIEAISELCKAGFKVTIATNQSGLARGYFQQSDLDQMHDKLHLLLEKQGGSITQIEFCPHGPDDNCSCRKPLAGMINTILSSHPDTAPGDVFVVGDSLRDLEAGISAGCKPLLVETGKGKKTLATGGLPSNTIVCKSLSDALDTIIQLT